MKIYSYFQSYLFLKSSPLMKYLFTFGLFIFSLGNPLFSQENRIQFDNKAYVEGEFLVQLTDPGKMESILKNAPSEFNLAIANFVSPPMMIWLLSFDANAISASGLQNWLYSQKGVIVADYNYFVYERETMPNDPSITQQWHHKNTGQTGGTVDADIDSDLAWDITTGGTTADGVDIVVCMVEGSGGNLDHQDLSPNRWVNTGEIPNNGIDDDNNGYIDDYGGWSTATNNDNTGTGGHGTSCLGMIGAKGDNGLNVVGANWDVKLMVVNMGGGLTQANVIAAYTYPYVMRKRWNQTNGAEGAFVVATSASWGIDGANANSYPLWCNFYDSLGHIGILNIGATTNSNLNVDTAGDMPTGCTTEYMIGVGRTDHNDNTAGGYGITTIDFGAPGINVVTTSGTNGITTTTGTSFACPLTAGVVGLAYSIPCTNFMEIVRADPRLGADMVRQAMIEGVDVKSQLQSKFITGGRLNARNTLDGLMGTSCSDCYSSNLTATVTGEQAVISFDSNSEVTSVQLSWREVGAATWTVVPNATSPYSLSDLESCTSYEFFITSFCSEDTTTTSVTNFSIANCGTCIDLEYCPSSSTAGSDPDEWIESFTINNIVFNTGYNNGYLAPDIASGIELARGENYGIVVVPGFSGMTYNEYSRIWIDFDQNGVFESTEMVYDQGTASTGNAVGTVAIPLTATLGSTRMRVQLAYRGAGQNSAPGVCASFQYGEVEDYCVTILEELEEEGSDVGINGTSFEQVAVYPNPSKNMVYFDMNELMSGGSIEIVDVVGKVIYSNNLKDNTHAVDVSSFNSGTYIYRVHGKSGDIKATGKLVVEK